MRLKRLVLQGFKSFAERVEFDFEPGITGIVGPNGCGKSNVVDSIKWVLGEQRPTKLRGTEMADVLFNGSGPRKSVGLAEVSLVFDNSDRRLPIDFQEVALTRKLYRSGESQYLLNNEVVRLRDLRELFMDTGVGVEAYSIMEQGRMDAFLEANPQERRVLFEEAAGISKYKAKKIESLRRLQRVEENLARLTLVTGEVESKIHSLKIQAGRARAYLDLCEELKALRIRISLASFAEATAEFERVTAEVRCLVTGVESGRVRLAEAESRAEAAAEAAEEHRRQIARLREERSDVGSRCREARERVEHGERRAEELSEDRGRYAREAEANRVRLADLAAEVERVGREQEEVENEWQAAHDGLEAQRARLEALESESRAAAEGVRVRRARAVELRAAEAELANKAVELEGEARFQAGNRARLERRAQEIGTERAGREAQLLELEANLAVALTVLEERRRELRRQEAEEKDLSDRIESMRARKAEMAEERSGLSSRLELLHSLSREGRGPDGGARALLAHAQNGGRVLGRIRGLVTEELDVDPDCALAVDAALAETALALVVEPGFDHAGASRYLTDRDLPAVLLDPSLASRATPVSPQARPPAQLASVTRARPLRARVREVGPSGGALARLLDNVYLTPTLSEAVRLVARSGPGVRAVTPSGEWVGDDGTVRVGRSGTRPLHRAVEVRRLAESLGSLQSELDRLDGTLEALGLEVGQRSASIKFLKRTVYDGEFSALESRKCVENQRQRIRELDEEDAGLVRERDEVERELARVAADAEALAARRAELATRLREVESGIQALEEEGEAREAEKEGLREDVTRCRVVLGQAVEKKRSTSERMEGARTARVERQAELDAAIREEAACRERIEKLSAETADAAARVAGLEEEARTLDARIAGEEPREAERMADLETRRAELREARSWVETESAKLSELRLKERELSIRREGFESRVRDEYGVELGTLGAAGFDPTSVDVAAEEEKAAEIKRKVERFGNVNLAAIEELGELEKRYEFLRAQKTDLETSRDDLKEILRKLNKKSKDLFAAAFEEIRGNFQELFRKLFGGGKADVFLTDPEDVLESGVEIIARPPGKEPRTVRLLSGGERAMTAIALMFAIFKTRPSPFAVLDEIDAPLDESNVDRFTTLVREFLAESQFLIITHSKRTMRACDVLYGVTMEESGVSKRISVRLEEAA